MANKFEGGPKELKSDDQNGEQPEGKIIHIPAVDAEHEMNPDDLKRLEEALKRVAIRKRKMEEDERKKKMN